MYRRIFSLAGFCVLPLMLFLTASVTAHDEALPVLADLEPGLWATVAPGGDTICSNGTPYQFFVRPSEAESSKLLIHFQGGGACWFGENCDLESNPTYDPTVDASDNPVNYSGIFDFTNAENPFSDYNMVMVSYCTADVHVGTKTTTYDVAEAEGKPAHEVTIHHNRYTNAMTVLDWTFENFQTPDTVFVTGCSAGAIASPLYTQWVAEAYPDARIEQLGDAAGGYRNPPAVRDTFGNWGTMGILPMDEYGDFSLNEMTFEQFYMTTAATFPDITMAQYNSASDEVQTFFLGLTGVENPVLHERLQANLDDISSAAPENFRSFTAGGVGHCVTPTPEFYTYSVNGMSFRDWVAALASGEEVETFACEDCAEPEIAGG
jgi:hypothetical protein